MGKKRDEVVYCATPIMTGVKPKQTVPSGMQPLKGKQSYDTLSHRCASETLGANEPLYNTAHNGSSTLDYHKVC